MKYCVVLLKVHTREVGTGNRGPLIPKELKERIFSRGRLVEGQALIPRNVVLNEILFLVLLDL